jgi:hypothetical protein
MNGKFLFLAILLVAAMAGCYAIFLEQDMDHLRSKTIVARQNITNLESQIRQLSQTMENKGMVAELMKTVNFLKEENTSLEDLLKKEEARYQPLVEAHRAAIAQVRRETVGRSYDELVLSNGTVLKAAMIQQVGEDELVIKHSLGIRRAPSKEWPAELKARLVPGALADTKPVAEAPAPAEVMPAAGVESEALKKHKKKLLDGELATKRIVQDLASLEKQLKDIESELSNDISASRKYYAEQRRDFLRAQVTAQKSRVTAAQEALARLQAEQPPP